MKSTLHTHPNPFLNRIVQYGAIAVAIVMLASVPLQVLVALLAAGGWFILTALFTVLLAATVLMLTASAPAVRVDAGGITLCPVIWKSRFVAWDAIKAVKVYPLLPAEDAEITRQLAVGRRRYRPATGIMLVIPGLPPQYRIAGFLAGERAAPVIALTNRAHADYATLVQTVLERTDPAVHDASLVAEG